MILLIILILMILLIIINTYDNVDTNILMIL